MIWNFLFSCLFFFLTPLVLLQFRCLKRERDLLCLAERGRGNFIIRTAWTKSKWQESSLLLLLRLLLVLTETKESVRDRRQDMAARSLFFLFRWQSRHDHLLAFVCVCVYVAASHIKSCLHWPAVTAKARFFPFPSLIKIHLIDV